MRGGHYVVGRLLVGFILSGMIGGGTHSTWVHFYFIYIYFVGYQFEKDCPHRTTFADCDNIKLFLIVSNKRSKIYINFL